MMDDALSESQTPLTPDDTCQLFDEMLLGRTLRIVLRHERLEQHPILVSVFPRQDGVTRQNSVSERIEASEFVIASSGLGKHRHFLRQAHVQNSLFGRPA